MKRLSLYRNSENVTFSRRVIIFLFDYIVLLFITMFLFLIIDSLSLNNNSSKIYKLNEETQYYQAELIKIMEDANLGYGDDNSIYDSSIISDKFIYTLVYKSLDENVIDKSAYSNKLLENNPIQYYYNVYIDEYYSKYKVYYNVKNNISSAQNTTTNTYDYDRIELESNITYYYNRFFMALQMCGTASSYVSLTSGYGTYYLKYTDNKGDLTPNTSSQKVNSYYGQYYNYIKDYIEQNSDTNYGIYKLITDLEEENHKLWETLYKDYSQFIYEATYENSDEVESISLYNQAISYFEDYHHPKSSYSVEVLNLEELEQIGTPNLKVNTRIRIYNEDLGLDEGVIGEGDISTDKLNNISYTNNELLITALSYDLRKSAAVSITVEKIVQHQNILQKLIKSIK